MKNKIPLEYLAQGGKLDFIDTDQIDELLALFEIHDLMPGLSTNEHMFANALAMLVSSLKWSGNAKHLFESLPYIKGREIDLLDILNTLTHLGFNHNKVVMNINVIDERLMPCLVIPERENASPLVFLHKKNNIITAFHSKKKQLVEFEAKSDFVVDAYFFQKNNIEAMSEDQSIKKSAGLSWFSILFSRFRPIMNQIMLTSIMINILSLAMPIFIMSIYNTVIGSGSTITLNQLTIGVAIAIFSEALLRMIRLRLIVWLGVRLDNIVSNTIFERLLLMKASYTESASISSQISRIKTFESIRKFFTGPLFAVIVEMPFTIILLFAIWVLTGPLVYIPIVVVTLFVIMLAYYQSKLRLSMRASARANSNKQEFAMETFLKTHSLHHNGMIKNWLSHYKEKLSQASITSFHTNMISIVIDTAAHVMTILSGVAIITYGVHLIWDKSITIGALVATIILIWRVLGPFQTLCSMLPRVEQLFESVDQINKLVSIPIEREPRVLTKPINHLDGRVEISNLGLRYSIDAEPIFVGLDIDIKPGEIIAITGSNGAGKSSVLKLINGLYQAQTGTIKIDGLNIKQMESIELRRYIDYMPQTPNFFKGTIKDNLLLANPLATDQSIIEVLKKVNGYDDVCKMPDGINTMIYSSNSNFPTGFEYTLNLARVMMEESNLMLLDEPNAALGDSLGDAYKQLIKDCKGKKTVLFVSQRDDFIKLADRVIVMKHSTRPVVMKSSEFINQYGK